MEMRHPKHHAAITLLNVGADPHVWFNNKQCFTTKFIPENSRAFRQFHDI